MGKRKISYQVKEKKRVTITLSGEVFLQYVDDIQIDMAKKGDVMMYAYNDALHSNRYAEYENLGLVGYFKMDVFDGREWKPVLVSEIFEGSEHHFGKKERPLDTYHVCADIVRGWKDRVLLRTYREHYTPDDGSENDEAAAT